MTTSPVRPVTMRIGGSDSARSQIATKVIAPADIARISAERLQPASIMTAPINPPHAPTAQAASTRTGMLVK